MARTPALAKRAVNAERVFGRIPDECQFRARFFDGWEGTGRVEVCEPPRHLLVTTRHVRQTDEHVIEATLTADGDDTILVLDLRGMPVNLLAEYGAGNQVHVEDLAAHIAGRERGDGEARWNELMPAYRDLAADAQLDPRVLAARISSGPSCKGRLTS